MATDTTLFSGGLKGAEAEFGAQAEKYGLEEVNFTFEGHKIERTRGVRTLTAAELMRKDVSVSYVSSLLGREFSDAGRIRRVLQTIMHQVDSGLEVFVIGVIQDDGTVKGRHRLGRRVRQNLQQAPVRVRPGQKLLEHLEGRRLGGSRRPGRHPKEIYRNRHPLPRRKRQAGHRRPVRPFVRIASATRPPAAREPFKERFSGLSKPFYWCLWRSDDSPKIPIKSFLKPPEAFLYSFFICAYQSLESSNSWLMRPTILCGSER